MADRLRLEPDDQRIFTSIMNRIKQTGDIANKSRVNANGHLQLVTQTISQITEWTRQLSIVASRVSALNEQIAGLGEDEEQVISKINDVLRGIASGLFTEEDLTGLERQLQQIQAQTAAKMNEYDQARTELTRLIAAIKDDLAPAPGEEGPGGPGRPGRPRGGPPAAPAPRPWYSGLNPFGRAPPAAPRPAVPAVAPGRLGEEEEEEELNRQLAELELEADEGVYQPPRRRMSEDDLASLGAADSDVEFAPRGRGPYSDNPFSIHNFGRGSEEEGEEAESSLGGGGSSLRRGGYTYPKKRTLRRRRRKQNKARKTHHAKKAHKKKQKTRGRKDHKKRATRRRRR